MEAPRRFVAKLYIGKVGSNKGVYQHAACNLCTVLVVYSLCRLSKNLLALLTFDMQVQFLSYVIQAVLALYDDCGFPRWVSYGMMMYMVTMISLFGNFYFKTYQNARRKQQENRDEGNGILQIGVVQNGSQKKLN